MVYLPPFYSQNYTVLYINRGIRGMGFIQVLSRGLFGFSFSEGAAYHTLGLGSSDHQDMRVIHGG